ncbi:uncharacterized protein LOC142017580 [Carettochelys insculpta]|uniref:uncharacterized protein LOC142017580 n=1 Tax=Carettochelys insculpta TaxID=44489 RepID=UPI003EBA1972
MEGPGRALLRLAAAACLLCGLLLPPPGDGQETFPSQAVTPAQPSTMPASLPLSKVASFSMMVTAPPVTSTDENAATVQPRVSSPHAVGLDEFSPSPNGATSTRATLQNPDSGITAEATAGLWNKNLSAHNSSELPPPALVTTAADATQPGQEETEPSGTAGVTGAMTVVPTNPPPNDSLEVTGSSQLESSALSSLGPTPGSPDPTPQTTPKKATEESTAGPATVPAARTTESTPAALAHSTATVTPTHSAATTGRVEPSADPMHEKASVLDVGDEDVQDLPSSAVAGPVRADPLVIGVVALFVVMVGILALVGFLRYRQQNSRMEFRRLQDLPMDDMMEDTPLSLYSY